MEAKRIVECERTKIEKWSQFQLSNRWKTVGVILSLSVFVILFILKFIDAKPEWTSGVLKRLLIVGFLIISISKEKQEDEMIASLRAKSYTLAFIIGVLYTLVQPGIDYIIDMYLISSSKTNSFSYFQILWFMLLIQIMFFEILKRNR